MSQTIINLYEELIDNWQKCHRPSRDFTVPDWHQRYTDKYKQCSIMQARLNSGEELDAEKDKKFLRWLIYKKQNSISNAGFCFLSLEDYHSLIADSKFMECLSELIKKPNASRLDKLGERWNQILDANGSKRSQLRVRRVAAAFTTEISSTVDAKKFDAVYKYFSNSGMPLSKNTELGNNDFSEWYVRNEELMEKLSGIFKSQIANGRTDAIMLSVFVWEVYEHKCKKPLR